MESKKNLALLRLKSFANLQIIESFSILLIVRMILFCSFVVSILAIISDFNLALDVVTVSVVYDVRNDGVKFSVRSEVEEIDAGFITRNALNGIGNGGGHMEMAGGFIPIEKVKELGENFDFSIEQRFLKYIQNI